LRLRDSGDNVPHILNALGGDEWLASRFRNFTLGATTSGNLWSGSEAEIDVISKTGIETQLSSPQSLLAELSRIVNA